MTQLVLALIVCLVLLARLIYFRRNYVLKVFESKITSLTLFFAAISRRYYHCNAGSLVSPFEVYCPICKKDYSRVSSTKTRAGGLMFFGMYWASYEEINCFCGKNLSFSIQPRVKITA